MPKIIAFAGFLALMTGSAWPQQAKIEKDAKGESYLQAPSGRTLYVFDNDGTGKGSSCDHQCADIWPPFKVEQGTMPSGDWSIVLRTDGSHQWAYKGRPLYTFSKDTAPGQQNGNSYNGNTWHVAEP